MKNVKKIIQIKKEIIEVDIDKINNEIFNLINEARTYPKIFSKNLNINDINNKEIQNLISFFDNYDMSVEPLILELHLTICSKDLFKHISYGDLEQKKEMNIKCLKDRLKKLNIIPYNYNNFIIFDADNSLDAVINLFLNEEYRNMLLNPKLKFIGISSGFLPSGNLCIIIDIAESLKSINNTPIKNKNIDNYNYYYYKTNNMSTNYTDKKNKYDKIILTKDFYNKNNNFINKRHKSFNKYKIKRNLFKDYIQYNYKYPIDCHLNRKYVRDNYGNLHLVYDKESYYDDGSVLIQPNFDLFY